MGRTEADVLSLDYYVDLVQAVEKTNKVVMGNVPTSYFMESGSKVYDYTTHLLSRTKGYKHIVASGCEIPVYALPEAVKSLKNAVMDWARSSGSIAR